MENLGLDPNTNYEGQGILVQHKNGTWFHLKKTTAKMLVCVGDKDQEKRMRPTSVTVIKKDGEEVKGEGKKENIDFEWNETIHGLYGGGENNPQFGNDFGMAGNPEFVVDNDGMFD